MRATVVSVLWAVASAASASEDTQQLLFRSSEGSVGITLSSPSTLVCSGQHSASEYVCSSSSLSLCAEVAALKAENHALRQTVADLVANVTRLMQPPAALPSCQDIRDANPSVQVSC